MLAHGILAQSQYAAPLAGPAYVTDGLVGYWDANDGSSYPGSGNTWTDLSGNGYDLGNNGTVQFTSGTPNYMNFDESWWWELNSTPLANTTQGDHTWMLAVNLDTISFEGIAGTDQNGGPSAGTSRMKAQLSTYSRFGIQTWDGADNAVNCWPSTNYSTGTWYIIAGTQQWVSPYGMELFVNNTSVATATQGSTAISGNLTHLRLGNVSGTANSDAMDGKMGFAMIYNKVLSSSELTQNWDAFKTTYGLS